MDTDVLVPPSPFATFSRRTVMGLILTGIVAGIITLLLTLAIDKVVLQPVMCSGTGATSACSQSPIVSFHIASIISAIVAVVILAQFSVYRPLLVGIATTIGLWGIYGTFVYNVSWPTQLISLIVLNILAYLAFTWILRVYNLVVALVITAILIVAMLLVTNL